MTPCLLEHFAHASPHTKARSRATNVLRAHEESMEGVRFGALVGTLGACVYTGWHHGPTGVYSTVAVGALIFGLVWYAKYKIMTDKLRNILKRRDAEIAANKEQA